MTYGKRERQPPHLWPLLQPLRGFRMTRDQIESAPQPRFDMRRTSRTARRNEFQNPVEFGKREP